MRRSTRLCGASAHSFNSTTATHSKSAKAAGRVALPLHFVDLRVPFRTDRALSGSAAVRHQHVWHMRAATAATHGPTATRVRTALGVCACTCSAEPAEPAAAHRSRRTRADGSSCRVMGVRHSACVAIARRRIACVARAAAQAPAEATTAQATLTIVGHQEPLTLSKWYGRWA